MSKLTPEELAEAKRTLVKHSASGPFHVERVFAHIEAVERENEDLCQEYERRGDVIVVWKMEAERLREKNEWLRKTVNLVDADLNVVTARLRLSRIALSAKKEG